MTQPVSVLPSVPSDNASAEEVLEWGIKRFGERFGISTSFQMGGMVILDMAVRLGFGKFQVFTIDTERLPEETYRFIDEIRERYGVALEVLRPDPGEVSSMVSKYGHDLFYEAVSKRRLCCEIRKVRPLKRKLASLDAWAVGLRREQSDTRENVRKIESDSEHGGIYKLSPLADWPKEQILEYVRQYDVPQHPLYAQGYTSIGCAPCTRATFPGEPARAGRWWWEEEDDKECGIHFTPSGVKRELDVLLEDVLQATSS